MAVAAAGAADLPPPPPSPSPAAAAPTTRAREDAAFDEDARRLRTVGQAADYVRERLQDRVDAARLSKPPPNKPLLGDAAVRVAFYTLLPPAQQRAIFLEFASRVEAWPRVRSLFGAPPFDFLLPGDASHLNASGFAAGRANMAHDATTLAAGYSHFGSGQLVDRALREYNIVAHGRGAPKDDSPLLCDTEQTPLGDIVLQVRVKRVARHDRARLIKDKERRVQLAFPMPGDTLMLRQTDKIRRLLSVRGEGRELHVTVKRTVPRAENASTAALLVTVK